MKVMLALLALQAANAASSEDPFSPTASFEVRRQAVIADLQDRIRRTDEALGALTLSDRQKKLPLETARARFERDLQAAKDGQGTVIAFALQRMKQEKQAPEIRAQVAKIAKSVGGAISPIVAAAKGLLVSKQVHAVDKAVKASLSKNVQNGTAAVVNPMLKIVWNATSERNLVPQPYPPKVPTPLQYQGLVRQPE